MAQSIFPAKGQIKFKNILPTRFAVTYQCACGGLVEFAREESKPCPQCHTRYQCRVIVGKASKQ